MAEFDLALVVVKYISADIEAVRHHTPTDLRVQDGGHIIGITIAI
jgi:hypothetical protein